jgi:hypothetical protein
VRILILMALLISCDQFEKPMADYMSAKNREFYEKSRQETQDFYSCSKLSYHNNCTDIEYSLSRMNEEDFNSDFCYYEYVNCIEPREEL